MGPRFVELFPLWRDEHAMKDIGMVPRHLARNGFSTEIWATRAPSASDLTVHALGSPFWARAAARVWREARSIDVLCLVHTHPMNPFIARIYRARNPRGVVYVKADMDESILRIGALTPLSLLRRAKIRASLAIADRVTIEQERILRFLAERYPRRADRMKHLPSGYGDDLPVPVQPYAKRRKRILVVGRVGVRQKATDVALAALELCAKDLAGWEVRFAGSVDPGFRPAINEFQHRNKSLGKHVLFHGPTKNRREMLELYASSRILLMPSRWEGFSNVPAEAAHFGNVIIGTAVGGVLELTDNGRIGALVPIDDAAATADALRRYLRSDTHLRRDSIRVRALGDRKYSWPAIARGLAADLRRLIAARAARRQ